MTSTNQYILKIRDKLTPSFFFPPSSRLWTLFYDKRNIKIIHEANLCFYYTLLAIPSCFFPSTLAIKNSKMDVGMLWKHSGIFSSRKVLKWGCVRNDFTKCKGESTRCVDNEKFTNDISQVSFYRKLPRMSWPNVMWIFRCVV